MSDSSPKSTAESLEVVRKFAKTKTTRSQFSFCQDLDATSAALKSLTNHCDGLGDPSSIQFLCATSSARSFKCFWNLSHSFTTEREQPYPLLKPAKKRPLASSCRTRIITTETIYFKNGCPE
tara:strand:+ start:192 stop:557 length:366 start_codon:yes stop_codon:yes gene_type:complete